MPGCLRTRLSPPRIQQYYSPLIRLISIFIPLVSQDLKEEIDLVITLKRSVVLINDQTGPIYSFDVQNAAERRNAPNRKKKTKTSTIRLF